MDPVALIGGTVVDVASGLCHHDQTVVISGGRISAATAPGMAAHCPAAPASSPSVIRTTPRTDARAAAVAECSAPRQGDLAGHAGP